MIDMIFLQPTDQVLDGDSLLKQEICARGYVLAFTAQLQTFRVAVSVYRLRKQCNFGWARDAASHDDDANLGCLLVPMRATACFGFSDNEFAFEEPLLSAAKALEVDSITSANRASGT
jgi:hypothetical protein